MLSISFRPQCVKPPIFLCSFISHILCYFMENHHNIGRCHQGLTYQDRILHSTLKNSFFKTDYIQEENFIKFHLPEWWFYLPQTFVNVIHKISSDAFCSGSICKVKVSQILWKNGFGIYSECGRCNELFILCLYLLIHSFHAYWSIGLCKANSCAQHNRNITCWRQWH